MAEEPGEKAEEGARWGMTGGVRLSATQGESAGELQRAAGCWAGDTRAAAATGPFW
jgi:hypothetical protein